MLIMPGYPPGGQEDAPAAGGLGFGIGRPREPPGHVDGHRSVAMVTQLV